MVAPFPPSAAARAQSDARLGTHGQTAGVLDIALQWDAAREGCDLIWRDGDWATDTTVVTPMLMALGCAGVLLGVGADAIPVILGGLIVLGVAVGVQTTPVSTLQVSSAAATKGTVSGIVAITFGLSTAMGIALATAIMQNVAIHALQGATGSHQLEGIDHQELLDILAGIRPMSDLSSAGQHVITAAFDKGAVTTSATFAVLAVLGAGMALKTLRDIVLHES